MLNQHHLAIFAKELQHSLPHIQALQILTPEGLTLLSDATERDDDQLSALSAMLLTGAQHLSHYLDPNQPPQGLIVCCEPSAYVVTRMTDDCMLGLKVPSTMGQSDTLQKVSELVSQHAHHLSMTH